MRAGDLRHPVILERLEVVDGPLGRTEEWVEAGRAWASIEAPSATARAAYQSMQHAVTHEVVLRYSAMTAGVIPERWRLRWDGRYLLPVEPARDPDGRRERVIVACRLEVA